MKLHDGVRRARETTIRLLTPRDRSTDTWVDDTELELENRLRTLEGSEASAENVEAWLEGLRKKHEEGE